MSREFMHMNAADAFPISYAFDKQNGADTDLKALSHQDRLSLKTLQTLSQVLSKTPTGLTLLTQATSYHFKIAFDAALDADASVFNDHSGILFMPAFNDSYISVKKNMGRALLTFIAGLRRALVTNQKHMHRFDLEPMEYARLIRILEADIDTVTTQVAWELRTAGETAPWRCLLAGDKGDLGFVYSQAIGKYPTGQFDGRIMRQVFRQWFAHPERVNAADHFALEMLDMALSYPDQFDITADKKLTKNDLRLVQKNLPFSNYLADINVFGRWFDGFKDAFNQAHLHHIIGDLCHYKDKS